QHRRGTSKWPLAVDDPLDPSQSGQTPGKGSHFGQPGERPEEPQLSGPEGGLQPFEEQPPEQARENRHRQEAPRPARNPPLAVPRQTAAGHQAVNMRMVL